MVPIIYVQQTQSGTAFALASVNVTLDNTFDHNEAVTLYVVSSDPKAEEYFPGIAQINAGRESVYTVSYQLLEINNGTQLFIAAFSGDSFATSRFSFTDLKP